MQQSLQKKNRERRGRRRRRGQRIDAQLAVCTAAQALFGKRIAQNTNGSQVSFLPLANAFCENHSNGGKKRSKAHSWPVEAVGSSYMDDTVSVLFQSENRVEKYKL